MSLTSRVIYRRSGSPGKGEISKKIRGRVPASHWKEETGREGLANESENLFHSFSLRSRIPAGEPSFTLDETEPVPASAAQLTRLADRKLDVLTYDHSLAYISNNIHI